MFSIEKLVGAIRGESLAGWLFYNRHHRDELADRLLDIPRDAVNTRPWLYLLPASGVPVKIVHAIEETILDRLPGRKVVYRGRDEFRVRIREGAREASGSGPAGPWGACYSRDFPRYSTLDHGTALMLADLGLLLASADSLILRALSVLTPAELESHEAAGRDLHRIVSLAWDRIVRTLFREKKPLGEGEVHAWIMDWFDQFGLETDGHLIVGAGRNTRLPHYFPAGRGAPLLPGQVVQLDIWGKKKTPGAIYADISWSGFLGSEPPPDVTRAFAAVARARDGAVALIGEAFAAGRPVTGADVDRRAEELLIGAGYGDFIRHRTGHSIDAEVHGYGINIDAREQPDERPLREGSCFSIEPGVYLDAFGIRTEIDVYIKSGQPVMAGGVPQRELLLAK